MPSTKTRSLSLSQLLVPAHIARLEVETKEQALEALLDLLSQSPGVGDAAALKQSILHREVMMSTGIGYGVAIPHAKISTMDAFVLAMGIIDPGINYGSPVDDLPVRLICMIAGPDREQDGYLKLLSTLMRFIKSEKGKILNSHSPEEITRFAERYRLELPESVLA